MDFIQMRFEKGIANWELLTTEDLFDEEYDEVVRVFNFSRGTKEYFCIINPRCEIRGTSQKLSTSLLVDIHNTLNGVMWKILRSGAAV